MTKNESILVYAARYALGRRTYAVADVCEAIEAHFKPRTTRIRLAPDTISVLRRDIGEELERGGGGDKCDRERWEGLLKVLAGFNIQVEDMVRLNSGA